MQLKFILLASLLTVSCFTANAQSGRKSNQPVEQPNQTAAKSEPQKEEKIGEIQPLKITRKPKPDTAVAADCYRNEGFSRVRTVLRVTFDASAKITDVELTKPSGCKEFDEESVDAARRIKFVPAVQNGKPISVTKTVIYEGGIR